MTLVRHSLFYSVPDALPLPERQIPNTGTNLQRRSDSMLRQPLNRRNTLAVCNPLIRIAASWVIVFNRSLDRHRVYTNHSARMICFRTSAPNPRTAGCPRLSTSDLYQPLFTLRVWQRPLPGAWLWTMLRLTNRVRLRPDHSAENPFGHSWMVWRFSLSVR